MIDKEDLIDVSKRLRRISDLANSESAKLLEAKALCDDMCAKQDAEKENRSNIIDKPMRRLFGIHSVWSLVMTMASFFIIGGMLGAVLTIFWVNGVMG